MSRHELPPGSRNNSPPGTAQSETAEVANLYCPCAATEVPPPVWTYDNGWLCSRPDLPGHDTSEAPTHYSGLIPCQPVTPWNPAEYPEMVWRREVAAEILREEEEGLY
jgi:hypothetical protein